MTEHDNLAPRTILCIEDEPSMIDLVELILNRRGFRVLSALGGTEGLETAREAAPDLILLDLMMPDMDGWDVYHQLRADDELSQTPVIIVTAKASNIDQVLGLRVAGVQDYITKPFSPSDLIERIDRVLAGKSPVSEVDEVEARLE